MGASLLQEEPRTPAAPQTPKPDVKPDIKPATPSRPPVQKKVFQADELRQALMPTLEKLFKLDESLPFRQAVDAIGLNIPVSGRSQVSGCWPHVVDKSLG